MPSIITRGAANATQFILTTKNPTPPPTISPILWLDAGNTNSYPGTGDTWYDLSKNNNNGNLTNSPTYNSANGGYFEFNGTDNYVSTTIQYDDPKSFTLNVWFQTTVASGHKLIGFQQNHLPFGDINDPPGPYDRQIYIGTDGLLYFGTYNINTGHDDTIHTSTPVTDGKWYNVTGTYSFENSQLTLYLNGVIIGTLGNVYCQSYSGWWIIASGWIRYWPNANDGYFPGNISIAEVYDVELTSDQVLQNFNQYSSRFPILWLDAGNTNSYPGTGDTWHDLSGNGNNGTLVNDPIYSTNNLGYIGDNSSNTAYVTLTNNASSLVFGTSDFSIECWCMPTSDLTSFVNFALYFFGGCLLSWDIGRASFNASSFDSSGNFNYTVRPDSRTNPDALLVQNTWNHIVYTRSGTTATLFYNGISVGTGTDSTDYLGTGIQAQYSIGHRENSEPWRCNVSIFRVYNGIALTQAQVLQNFNNTRGRYNV